MKVPISLQVIGSLRWFGWLAVVTAAQGMGCVLLAQTDLIQIRQPIALAVSEATDSLVVLESHGRLLRIDPNPLPSFEILVDSFDSFQPLGMTIGTLPDYGEVIAVTLRLQRTASSFNRIVFYSKDGDKLKDFWLSPAGVFVSLAFDTKNQRLYVNDSRIGEIQAVEIPSIKEQPVTPAKQAHFRFRFKEAAILGPIALDSFRNHLYAADVLRGKLYQLNIGEGEERLIASGLGGPHAVHYDRARQRLLIADARRLWVLDTTRPTEDPIVFGDPNREFRQITGVTVGADGTIWLADQRVNQLFSYSPEGRIGSTIP